MSERAILERNVAIPLRDGTVTMADVYRPDDGERHPVLLQRTPYDKMLFPFTWAPMDASRMALAGYAVVIQDVRGRFASAGRHVPYSTESEDGSDTIAWCAEQPWSDGTVGMYGISYMGGAQWMAEQAKPPALRALAPLMSATDFGDKHTHRGGALQLGLVDTWTLVSIAPNELIRRFAGDLPRLIQEVTALVDGIDALDDWHPRVPLVPHASLVAAAEPEWIQDWLSDEALARPSGPENVSVPVMQIAGWYDLLLQGNLDAHVALRERGATEQVRTLSRIIIGPWAHPPPGYVNQVGDIDFGLRTSGVLLDLREDLTGLHRRWFDARMKGIQTGIDDEPPVKLFVMGRNRWRSEDTWPIARAKVQRWHLHGDGTLAPRPPEDASPSVFSLDPDNPVPTVGGNILMKQSYVRGPVEQTRVERHPDVLTFTSEPLDEELEVTGRVLFRCWVAAETLDTDVVARLCDVHPDGRSYNIVDGILRLRFRDGFDDPQPLTPGDVVAVEVDLWSTSHVFLPGHRLRLQVRASDFPRYDRCPGTGESSIAAEKVVPQRNLLFHDPQRPTHLTLEVVPS